MITLLVVENYHTDGKASVRLRTGNFEKKLKYSPLKEKHEKMQMAQPRDGVSYKVK